MEPLCEFCGRARAVVYCKSDTVCLCLSCDGYVHSANVISQKHLRSLICNNCNSQPAFIRCIEDKLSLCQRCSDGNRCSGCGQHMQTINFYSGCPSVAELSKIWASILDSSFTQEDVNTGWEPQRMMSMDENTMINCWEPRQYGLMVTTKQNEPESDLTSESWIGSSSEVPPNEKLGLCAGDKPSSHPENSDMAKVCSPLNDLGLCDVSDLFDDFNIDDVKLIFEDDGEIFGSTQSHPNVFDDVEVDCLFMDKNFLVAESSGTNEDVTEAPSSSRQHDCMAVQSSCAVGLASEVRAANSGTDRVLLVPGGSSRNINLCFPTGKVQSSMSNLTSECSVSDYQHCGVSPVFLTSGSPWDLNLEGTFPLARDKAKLRYNEKKKTRTYVDSFYINNWKQLHHLRVNNAKSNGGKWYRGLSCNSTGYVKQIKYASRKARADTRKRVKGRFVKAGEASDHDPLVARNF